MKKFSLLIGLIALMVTSFIAQCPASVTVNIPDVNFKNALPGIVGLDANSYGKIQCTEVTTLTGTKDVSIKTFSDLTSLDVFLNASLKYLLCNNNFITTVNVSPNSSLKPLYCNKNLLTNLNVKNGNKTNFEDFNVSGYTGLTGIKVDDAGYSTHYWSVIYQTSSFARYCAAPPCVNPTNAGTIAHDQEICNGSVPALINNSTLPLGQTGTLEYKWQSSTDAAFTTAVDITNNAASYTPTSPLSIDTWYRRLVKVTCENVWVESNAIKITVDPTSVGGAVTGGTTICNGSSSGLLTLTGQTGAVVKWQSGVLVSGILIWTDIANTNTTYTSGSLTQNTRFRVFVKSGLCSQAISANTLVTVNPLSVGGTVASNQTICSGSIPANLSLSGNTGSVVRWEKSSDVAFTTPATITGTLTTLTGVTIGNLTSNTYFRAVVKSGSCSEANSAYVLISVDPTTVGGTISGSSTICSGNTSGLLSLTGYTGEVQKWQSAVAPFTVWSDITNSNDTYTSGVLSETTRFRAVVKSGACLTLNSGYKQIVVKPNPSFTTGTVSPSNCYGDDVLFTASGLLPNINNTFYSTITYGSTVLHITRNVASDALGNASYTGTGFSPDNYSYELTSIVVSGCTTSFTGLTSTFVVHPLPTATISGSITVCNGTTPQPEITLTGASGTSSYTFSYSINSGGNLIAVSTGNSISLPQSTLSSGDFIYILVSVTDNNACSQLQTGTATVTVDPVSVGGSISGTSIITYGSSTGIMTLSGFSGSILRWEKKLNTGSWTSILNTSSIYNEIPTDAGSWYYRAVIKNGVCSETNSDNFILTVNKKSLSIKADDKTKNFDGLVYSPFTVTYNGFISGENETFLGGSLIFSGNATTAVNVGNYTITPGGSTSDNYSIIFQNGTLNITYNCIVNVSNNLDDGIGSLRNAIANVCDNGTIYFNNILNNQCITLSTGTLIINKNITFDNSNHTNGISISGSGDNITISSGKKLSIASEGKITITGNIKNNASISGLQIASGASLIQNTMDLQATVKRLLNPGWHLFGSPFKQNTGSSLAGLIPLGGNVQMIPYSNGINWGSMVSSPYYYFLPTSGYAVKPSAAVTATLTGNLYYSPIDYTISLIYNGTAAAQSWNLVANPYTSYINWNLLGKTNLNTSLYLWDNALYPLYTPLTNAAYFRTYNSCNNVGVPAGTTPYIAPLQGFFVRAVYTAPKLSFLPSARMHSTSAFYKGNPNTEILVRLKIENKQGTDELVICKNSEARLDLEKFDSEKLFGGLPLEIYSQSTSGEKLVINTINSTQTIIPLGINGSAGIKTRITAFDLESSELIYLEDRLKGKLISLSENTIYDFEFPGEHIEGRFFIRFGDINTTLTSSDVKIFESDNLLNIIAQTGEEIHEVEVFTVTGSRVFKSDAGSNVMTAKLDLTTGVYLVRVKTSIETQNVKICWK